MTFISGPLPRTERLLFWAALLGFLTIGGFQLGRLGAGLSFPASLSGPAQSAKTPQFDDAQQPTGRPLETAVAPIFGTPAPTQAPATAAPKPIPPASSYALRGITVVGPDRWAMLTADGANILVRMGDQLPGGETVKEITPDAVLVSQNGALSVLEFTRTDAEAPSDRPELMADFAPSQQPDQAPRVTTVTPSAPAPAPAQTQTERPALQLQTLRRAIYAPNALSNVHFTRSRTLSGRIGWKLKWIKDSPLIQAAGLERGDVLLAINGVPITDSKGLEALLLGLGKLDIIEIEYERRKRPMRVTIPLIKS